MADDTAGNIAAVSQQGNIQGLIALMNALYPAGGYNSSQTTGPQTVTTSDKTQTTEEIASPEAVQQLVQQMLQGSSGLAAVAQGEKGAGLYNTTTNQQLMNDLMSRVASAGAALNKKTVQTISGGTTTTSGQTTTANKTMTPQLTAADLAKLVGGGAAAAALAKAAGDAMKNQTNPASANKANNRKKSDAEEPPGDKPDNEAAYNLMNGPVWDQQFIQAIDPSMRSNPSDQIQFAAQGDSMLMTPVNDYNGLLNQSLNMGGLLNENNVESTNQPVDPTGSIDLGNLFNGNDLFGNDSGNSGGFFQNVGMGNDTPSMPSQDYSNSTPSNNNAGYSSWEEYNAANPNTSAGDRFSIGGTEYIATGSDNVVPYDSFESNASNLGYNYNDMSNFDWGSFDADAGYNGADDWLNYGTW